ncbi:hypothetical protein K435DRAFT_653309 [Dendrothele bispora CBS 962.96]|uniref:hAT-like transposase RNase-H fold domain-containing protein n=1 Tax=Dendrothele bispora (strain CBS 962.96) TaxID=1314807 RepID=A0A4S8MJ14_DENBC|nr:hypothetical protein K435DRAFT_653309 [Dendrothele bispora CBS 962.96]
MMENLEKILRQRKIPFDRHGNRVRCFPHVINIAVKTGLSYATKLAAIPAHQVDEDEALESDLVATARKLVTFCRASGGRRDDFRDVVIEMKEELLRKKQETGELEAGLNEVHYLIDRVVVLLRDVETRWSSIFLMIDRLLELYPAVEKFVKAQPNCDVHLFSNIELQVLADIREYLYAFHAVQEIASAEKTPTLSMVLPLYEDLIGLLQDMKAPKHLQNLEHLIDASLGKIQEYMGKSRKSRIHVLAMGMSYCFITQNFKCLICLITSHKPDCQTFLD